MTGLKELLDEEIKVFLETAPLYVWREFLKPSANRLSLLIEEVDSECSLCDRTRPFHAYLSHGAGSRLPEPPPLKSGSTQFDFTCVSCRKERREYHVQHVVANDIIRLQKYGELPRLPIRRDRALQKFLKDDLDAYEKGIVCLSHEYGVAAFAYFRRVLENNVRRLLELVEEDARASGEDDAVLEAIAQLRPETPMSDKIRIANVAMPGHLRVDGINPLGRLYQVLSEGVHTLPDGDCLEKANVINDCLKFLVGELASRRERRANFKSSLGRL